MYRTIDTAIWTDPKVRQLDAEGKLLFAYLITNSHAHVSGIYYIPNEIISLETSIKIRGIDTLWHTLSRLGLVRRDEERSVVWVVKMLDRQGKGEKMDGAASAQLKNLHNSPLIKDFLQFYAHRKIGYTIPQLIPHTEASSGAHTGTGTGTVAETGKKPAFALDTIEYPDGFDVPSVRSAITKWLDYKRKRRQSYQEPDHQMTLLLRDFARPSDFIAAVDSAIGRNYSGCFPSGGKNGNNSAEEFNFDIEEFKRETNYSTSNPQVRVN
jgi:hypothetical protein